MTFVCFCCRGYEVIYRLVQLVHKGTVDRHLLAELEKSFVKPNIEIDSQCITFFVVFVVMLPEILVCANEKQIAVLLVYQVDILPSLIVLTID